MPNNGRLIKANPSVPGKLVAPSSDNNFERLVHPATERLVNSAQEVDVSLVRSVNTPSRTSKAAKKRSRKTTSSPVVSKETNSATIMSVEKPTNNGHSSSSSGLTLPTIDDGPVLSDGDKLELIPPTDRNVDK